MRASFAFILASASAALALPSGSDFAIRTCGNEPSAEKIAALEADFQKRLSTSPISSGDIGAFSYVAVQYDDIVPDLLL